MELVDSATAKGMVKFGTLTDSSRGRVGCPKLEGKNPKMRAQTVHETTYLMGQMIWFMGMLRKRTATSS
jgi:hypothetical protein